MTPTPLPRPLHMEPHVAQVTPGYSARYSHSRPYINGDRWQACALRLFMRRVAECELDQTVYGVLGGKKVAFWRESEETVWLFIGSEVLKSRERKGLAEQVAWARVVLDA